VHEISLDGRVFTQTQGAIIDSSGKNHQTRLVRIYDCPRAMLPGFIERKANSPTKNEFDKHLVFEKQYGGAGSVGDVEEHVEGGRSWQTGHYKLYPFQFRNTHMTFMIGVQTPDDPQNQPGIEPVLIFRLYKCESNVFPSRLLRDFFGHGEMDKYFVSWFGYDFDESEPNVN
jgi:hypothetical protein